MVIAWPEYFYSCHLPGSGVVWLAFPGKTSKSATILLFHPPVRRRHPLGYVQMARRRTMDVVSASCGARHAHISDCVASARSAVLG